MSNNQLSDFTLYMESLCKKHIDILHSDDQKHFVELNKAQQLTESKLFVYPLVTIDKLTVNYQNAEDFMTKNQHVEIMFLESVSDPADYAGIQQALNKMERITEDFIRKMKIDKRDRQAYPYLRNLALSDIELNFVENSSLGVYGTLLSMNFELPFVEVLDQGRFI